MSVDVYAFDRMGRFGDGMRPWGDRFDVGIDDKRVNMDERRSLLSDRVLDV